MFSLSHLNPSLKLFRHMIDSNNFDFIKATTKGENINRKFKRGLTPLILSCYGPPASRISSFLIENGADVNAFNQDGRTALWAAAFKGDVVISLKLIKNGAVVNHICSKDEQTPLHIACQRAHVEIVSLLIEAGANIQLTDKFGDTPLHKAVRYVGREDNRVQIALHLIEHGCNVNRANCNGETALDLANLKGKNRIVECFLKVDAKSDVKPTVIEQTLNVTTSTSNEFQKRLVNVKTETSNNEILRASLVTQNSNGEMSNNLIVSEPTTSEMENATFKAEPVGTQAVNKAFERKYDEQQDANFTIINGPVTSEAIKSETAYVEATKNITIKTEPIEEEVSNAAMEIQRVDDDTEIKVFHEKATSKTIKVEPTDDVVPYTVMDFNLIDDEVISDSFKTLHADYGLLNAAKNIEPFGKETKHGVNKTDGYSPTVAIANKSLPKLDKPPKIARYENPKPTKSRSDEYSTHILKHQHHCSSSQLTQLESQRDQLKASVSKSKEKCENVARRLKTIHKLRNCKAQELAKLDQQIKELQQEVTQLKQKKTEGEAKISNLNRKIALLRCKETKKL